MTPFSSNLLHRLPSESRAKIIEIDHARAAAHAAVRAAQARQADAHEALNRAKLTAAAAIAAFPRAGLTDEDRERLSAPVAPAEAEADRADHAVDMASVRFRMFSYLSDAEDWLKRAVSLGVNLQHTPLPPHKDGGDRVAAVTALRASVEACGRDWAATAGAPAPASEVKKALIAEIDQLAGDGSPRLNIRARGIAPVDIRSLMSIVLPGEHAIGDPAPFLIWLFRDVLADRLCDLVDQAPLEGALTDRQRDKALSQIAAKRLALEFQEEAEVVAAAAVGQAIERRRNLDPRALFEVREV